MACFPTLRYFIILFFFVSHFKTLTADPNPSFSFKNFGGNSSFDSVLALHGDARVVNGGSSVQITAPSAYSAGRMIYGTPIKLYAGAPRKLVSFSTYFSFSVSENGGGLAFVLFPIGYPMDSFDRNGSSGLLGLRGFKLSSVELDALTDENRVGISLSGFDSLKFKNLSSVDLVLKRGEKLQSWIDYEAGSKQLEVRLSRFGENRPLEPLIFDQIDLSRIWPAENEGFLVGLTSSNGNSSQTCNVYSWSFKARNPPDWMHSHPLDPNALKEDEMKVSKKSDCVMKILSALIVGIGCGALGTFIGTFVWTVCANRRPIVPEEYATESVEEFEHNKLMVVLDKASANEKQ